MLGDPWIGDNAGMLPTEDGIDMPDRREGDICGTTLTPAPPVAGLKKERKNIDLVSDTFLHTLCNRKKIKKSELAN